MRPASGERFAIVHRNTAHASLPALATPFGNDFDDAQEYIVTHSAYFQ
jgi:hypothetical protein